MRIEEVLLENSFSQGRRTQLKLLVEAFFYNPPNDVNSILLSKNYSLFKINREIDIATCRPVISLIVAICKPQFLMEIIEVHAIPRLSIVSILSIIFLLILLWFTRNWMEREYYDRAEEKHHRHP